MTKKPAEKQLEDDIFELYINGAQTICLTKEQIKVVLGLLAEKDKIRQGSELAQKYLNAYIKD